MNTTPSTIPAGPTCPTCDTDDWDFTSNDQARCANGHSWTQPVEDDQASPTPVADALQLVDQAGTEYGVPSAELRALRMLADAVRSHGIGAELGQRREPGCDVCGLPLERVDVNGPGEYAHAGDEPTDGHAPVLPRAFVPPA